MLLKDKLAVITGGAKGIGNAIAKKLASSGAHIVILDINQVDSMIAVEEIQQLGFLATYYQVDVSDILAVKNVLDEIEHEYKRLDILINGVGIMKVNKFLEVTEENWDTVMNVNAKSQFFCMQEAAQKMMKLASGGKIINIASITAKASRPDYPVYAASKAAILSMTKSAATALAPYNITVNAVCPGFVYTTLWDQMDQHYVEHFGYRNGEVIEKMISQIPLKRAGKEEEIASFVHYLCSEEANYITGQAMNVDGGAVMY